MEIFAQFIDSLVTIGVVIGAVRTYLRVNKIWKRKEEKVVAQSISLFEKFLGFFIAIPFFVKFVLIDENGRFTWLDESEFWLGINKLVNMTELALFLLIGMGIWVVGNQGRNWTQLFWKALHLERKESTDLLKVFFPSKGARQILEILKKVSAIDLEITSEEIELIQNFAKQWGVDPPELKEGKIEESTSSLLELRENVNDYLRIKPPPEQAAQLVDVLELMIKADQKVTKEENLIYEELTGLLNNYVENGNATSTKIMYQVLIVPQREGEKEKIQQLYPTLLPVLYHSGEVFNVGSFYSKSYAEAICQKYKNQGWFTFWELQNKQENVDKEKQKVSKKRQGRKKEQ